MKRQRVHCSDMECIGDSSICIGMGAFYTGSRKIVLLMKTCIEIHYENLSSVISGKIPGEKSIPFGNSHDKYY